MIMRATSRTRGPDERLDAAQQPCLDIHGIRLDHLPMPHAAQPRDLPLGQLPRRRHAALADVRQVGWIARVQRLPGLPVADAAHRRQVQVQRRIGPQPAHLVEKPEPQHRIEALRDARVQPCAGRRLERQQCAVVRRCVAPRA